MTFIIFHVRRVSRATFTMKLSFILMIYISKLKWKWSLIGINLILINDFENNLAYNLIIKTTLILFDRFIPNYSLDELT